MDDLVLLIAISIHALRVEGDLAPRSFLGQQLDFYPRPPGGGRRRFFRPRLRQSAHFYPRPPGGGRRQMLEQHRRRQQFLSTPSGWRATASLSRYTHESKRFLSTPSGWRATIVGRQIKKARTISIHALRVEGDNAVPDAFHQRKISIHALRVEGDINSTQKQLRDVISIHALRVEGDRSKKGCVGRRDHFYPRPPGGGRPAQSVRL